MSKKDFHIEILLFTRLRKYDKIQQYIIIYKKKVGN